MLRFILRLLFALDATSFSTSGEVKKRPRTAFTPEQIKRLESEFQRNKYLSVGKRMELSKALKLTETQVISQQDVEPLALKIPPLYRLSFLNNLNSILWVG